MNLFAKTFAVLNKNNILLTDSIDILSKITKNEFYNKNNRACNVARHIISFFRKNNTLKKIYATKMSKIVECQSIMSHICNIASSNAIQTRKTHNLISLVLCHYSPNAIVAFATCKDNQKLPYTTKFSKKTQQSCTHHQKTLPLHHKSATCASRGWHTRHRTVL